MGAEAPGIQLNNITKQDSMIHENKNYETSSSRLA